MGAGMDFLTRPLILSLSVMVIIGCTSKPIKSSYELFYDSITTDKIQLSQSIKDLRYASSIMQLDNKDEIFSVLASYRNGSHKWVTSDDKIFIIDNGKVVRAKGLDFDFEIIGYEGYGKVDRKNNAYIRFKDPDSGYMDISFTYKLISTGTRNKPISNDLYSYRLIEESFSVPSISWAGKNYYWIDKDNNVWVSKQKISPFGQKIRIKLLKKYSG